MGWALTARGCSTQLYVGTLSGSNADLAQIREADKYASPGSSPWVFNRSPFLPRRGYINDTGLINPNVSLIVTESRPETGTFSASPFILTNYSLGEFVI